MPAPTLETRARLARGLLAAVAGAFVAAQLVGSAGGPPVLALVLASLAGVVAILLWRQAATRVGPRHLLDIVLPFAALVLLVLAVWDPLALPERLRLLTHPLLAASLTLAWLGTRRAPGAGGWRADVSDGLAAVAGALAWAGATQGLGVASSVAGLALLFAALGIWWLVWPIQDPVHPGPGPLRPYVPWGEQPGRAWPSWSRLPLRAPATIGYLVLSWGLFAWLGRAEPGGGWGLDTTRYEAWLYHIPDLSQAPLDAVVSLGTSPFLNHDHIQLVYVTVLLGLFGLAFEVREGTARAAAVFAIAGLAGALVAGMLLHGLVAAWPDVGVIEEAWSRTWSGGSVGAFGLMGALSARASKPWPLFGFFVFWELNVGAWYLRSYTPAFHLTALVTGYLVARHLQGSRPSTG